MSASPRGGELSIVTLELDDRGGGKVASRVREVFQGTYTLRCQSPLLLGAWRVSGGAQRLDVADHLPALRLRQPRPYRHSTPHDAVRYQPKERSRRGFLHLLRAEAGTLLPAIGTGAMTLGTVKFEELGSCSYGVGV